MRLLNIYTAAMLKAAASRHEAESPLDDTNVSYEGGSHKDLENKTSPEDKVKKNTANKSEVVEATNYPKTPEPSAHRGEQQEALKQQKFLLDHPTISKLKGKVDLLEWKLGLLKDKGQKAVDEKVKPAVKGAWDRLADAVKDQDTQFGAITGASLFGPAAGIYGYMTRDKTASFLRNLLRVSAFTLGGTTAGALTGGGAVQGYKALNKKSSYTKCASIIKHCAMRKRATELGRDEESKGFGGRFKEMLGFTSLYDLPAGNANKKSLLDVVLKDLFNSLFKNNKKETK